MRPYVNILLHVFLSVFRKYSVALHVIVREHMHYNIKIGSCITSYIGQLNFNMMNKKMQYLIKKRRCARPVPDLLS